MQLFPSVPLERISTFSCGHVIPASNLQCLVIGKGPSGRELHFTYKDRGNEALVRRTPISDPYLWTDHDSGSTLSLGNVLSIWQTYVSKLAVQKVTLQSGKARAPWDCRLRSIILVPQHRQRGLDSEKSDGKTCKEETGESLISSLGTSAVSLMPTHSCSTSLKLHRRLIPFSESIVPHASVR